MNVRSGGEEVGVSVTEVAGAALIETLCNTHAGAINIWSCTPVWTGAVPTTQDGGYVPSPIHYNSARCAAEHSHSLLTCQLQSRL